MKRRAKLWTWAALAVVAVCGALAVMLAGIDAHERFVQALPAPLRLYYLNRVFDKPQPDCNECYVRLTGALRALARAQERGEDYGFDYVRLFPLLHREVDFDEPIPGAACWLVMAPRDERMYKALVEEFRQDPEPLKVCIWRRLVRLKELDAAEYASTRAALLKTPGMAAYVEAQW